jgi:ubiquinone biosynthesis protein UbiJ
MGALETLLSPAAAMINRQIRAKTPARELCAELNGRVMALRVSNTGLAMYLIVEGDRIVITGSYADDPDVLLSGSLLSLSRLVGPDGAELIRHRDVELHGDAVLAERFRKLLRYGRPDAEEELSAVIGDVAAHRIGEILRGVGAWSRDAGATMRRNIGEYLQEESRTLPSRYETDSFRARIEELSDDVARFEARLKKLEAELEPGSRGKR